MESALSSWKVVRATWLTQRPHRFAWFVAAWSVFLILLASTFYWNNYLGAAEWMPASFQAVFKQGQYWRLWTTLFAHADLGHLLSNSLLFFIFGYFLNGYFGVLVFPLAALVFGGITNALVLSTYPPTVKLIGVSGVVYWMGGMWLVLYLLLDKQRTWVQRILRSVGVALGVFMPSTAFDPQISYQAHFVGFLLGIVCGFLYYFLRRKTFAAAVVTETHYEEPEVKIEKAETEWDN
ncbi:rhomboid family intramembrane serine protease [Bdellovibrio sp. 22V]|uniref:rhomboid family intramembrane serine protease n=1 Tax=Bdellovibrio sp. 22V TaxID=3044166 RepID=UPI002542A56C|nr:rhomboid family intramembrane serine protease [Bdellovibrio sp. 22V]WII73142.1 rhomboid family intramembrane serine protease [Bdellovibrio sp. 22V]